MWDGGAGLSVWSRELRSGARAVALLNRSEVEATVAAEWWQIGLTGAASVRDLWARADRGLFSGNYAAVAPPHAMVMVRITPGSTPIADAGAQDARAPLDADRRPCVAVRRRRRSARARAHRGRGGR